MGQEPKKVKQVRKHRVSSLQEERTHQKVLTKIKQEQMNKGKERQWNDNSDEDANVVEEFNIVYDDEESISLTTHETNWVIDNATTTHVISWKELFSSYTLKNYGVVKMGNDKVSEVVGNVDVFFEDREWYEIHPKGC